MEATKVGIREFRAGMAGFIASSTPVAVTRHGQTVGYFIPTQGQADADIVALKKAGKTLDRLLQPLHRSPHSKPESPHTPIQFDALANTSHSAA